MSKEMEIDDLSLFNLENLHYTNLTLDISFILLEHLLYKKLEKLEAATLPGLT